MSTKDLFSAHANLYAAFRPTYPKELYDFIFGQVKNFHSAWDAGTGNGQVARDLSERFSRVYATDISEKQLANAEKAENIFYSVAGETSGLGDQSVDLVTVAQAIHWFDIPKFYSEVKRVARPGGILAVWGYALLSVSPPIDTRLNHFYKEVVGPYWDKERRLVDERYQTIPFPFAELEAPPFKFSVHWHLNEFQGYLTTWSAVQKFMKANGSNPVPDFIREVRPLWKDKMQIDFPLFLRLGKV